MTTVRRIYRQALRRLVLALAMLAGGAITGMMVLTCADVAARALGRPITGAYDGVCLMALIAMTCALPYTTAVKGHVAVEFFFNKLPPWGRLALDSVMRLMTIGLFAMLAVHSVKHALRLRDTGTMMATLPISLFWAALIMAAAFAVVALVIIEQLVRPREALLTP